jgi:4-aminobutyrate aminotransferase-like enzyme
VPSTRPVDLAGTGPPLGRDQHDHGPARAGVGLARARGARDRRDLGHDLVEHGSHALVHGLGIRALQEARRIAAALEQAAQFLAGDGREHGRVGDLVAVEVQHWKHRAVVDRVEELVRVPACRQRPGLGLAVAHHAAHEQSRVVEHRAVRMRQRVAQLAALVN